MPALAREDELPALVKMVAKHEGAAAARLAESWFKNQPQGVLVLRDGDGAAAGFLFTLNLNGVAPEELQADAGTRAAWSYLQREAPLRPGENASLVRFWMASDTHQAVSAAQSLIFVNIVRHYLTAPKLAFSFFCCADPDFWTPAFEYADSPRLHDADFEVGKKSYGMFGHDWRVTPPMVWLELLAEREIATSAILPTAPPPAFRVLGEREFSLAVRAALHDFSRPPALSENALLHSRLVNEIAGIENLRRIAVLQNLLKEACETLQAAPQTEKYYQALFRTYLQPATSQEQTAELLDISFSTFRRHLKEGTERVTEILWQRELGELGTDERL